MQQVEGTLRADQATVENAKLQLTYCKIVAPISGRIGLRLVDQGNIVRANDPNGMAVITQLQPIALVFTIRRTTSRACSNGCARASRWTVDAFDRDFKMKLRERQAGGHRQSSRFDDWHRAAEAMFENEDGLLFPNQFVNARLHLDTKHDTIVVPSAAIQRGPTSMFVYVAQPDETVELRKHRDWADGRCETAIESGLAAGEIVVTEGLDKLQPGAKITTRGEGEEV